MTHALFDVPEEGPEALPLFFTSPQYRLTNYANTRLQIARRIPHLLDLLKSYIVEPRKISFHLEPFAYVFDVNWAFAELQWGWMKVECGTGRNAT